VCIRSAPRTNRLADIIDRAGGLTPQAYPDGIRFVRPTNAAGRINIDLTQALQQRESRDNVIMQPSDSVFVPEFLASVKVTGAVNSAGSVLWKRGEGLAYYIDAAGGFTYLADRGRVSIRFANGEVRTRRVVPNRGLGQKCSCGEGHDREDELRGVVRSDRADPGEHGGDHRRGDAVMRSTASAIWERT